MNSNNFDTNIPVYNAIPEKWEDARQFLTEQLKLIANGVNVREVGYLLDVETVTGKLFIPSDDQLGFTSSTTEQFRTVFRKVINCSPLVPGANSFPHGLNIDANFTLICLWVSATDSVALTGYTMVYEEVTYDATDIIINSPAAFDRAYAFIEYIQEV